MIRNLYALLVGINEYAGPITPLSGCVNDINAVEEYLKERVSKEEGEERYQMHLRKLLNQDATRQAIIDGFRQHLCQAGSDDVVLFYYSGHGSQARTPKEFWHLEPDRLEETLVCYDSRSEGSWGLADKELAKLIAEVSEQDPHISIILDCCHSGSGTRNPLQETGGRRFCTDDRERPLDSYIFSLDELEPLSTVNKPTDNPENNPTGWKLPKGRHVLLSACRDYETAGDSVNGQQRGPFSYFLMETLQNNGKLTYRDLFKQANALVRSHVSAQSPQFEATHSEDENRFFLNGAITERTPYFTVSYTKEFGWVIDGGAVHGVKSPSNDETTLLALFPIDSQDLYDPSKSVGEAKVTQVLPAQSKVSIDKVENLTNELTFKAVVTALPLPPLGVYFEGEEEGINLARQTLHSVGLRNQPSAYVREEQELAKAQFRLLSSNEQYLIVRPTDDRPLVEQIDGYTSENAKTAIQRLEHIARWTTIAELTSPPTSQIRAGDVEMEIIPDEEVSQSKEMRLEYQYMDDEWRQPGFRLKLTNKSKKPLYCAVVDLADLFDVSNLLQERGCVRLEPGESEWVPDTEGLNTEVPDALWEQGITEYKDIFKLIVSTTEFDARLMTQEELDAPRPPKRDLPSANQSTLDRLMNRVQNRAAKPRSQGRLNDWYTEEIAITTVRPLDVISVSSTKQKELRAGVQLQPHPSLQAKLRLTTAPQASRDLGNMILPPIFREYPEVTQSFQFATTRGTAPGLSILELNDVQDHTVVTPDAPLKLVVDTPLRDNEYLLPIGYDGEFFLPLGVGKRTQDGKTEIELERLPAPVSQGRRSLQGSINICFQKVVSEAQKKASEKLGVELNLIEFEYPRLAVAAVGDDKTITYETDAAVVKQRVAQAQRIVLYIHGIIGDTQSLASSIQQPVEVDGQQRSLAQLYDLVLTFDYENLNTSIEENARLLKQRLEEVGLGANHGKVLHIVAHSMGGLVSRWFIEQEGGNKVVQHLIMLGTPNAGSPWPTVKELATFAMAIGINSLSTVALPAKVLGRLGSAIMNTIEVALDQMQPNSEFLQALAASEDPGIPYSIIAGNTSIIPADVQQQAENSIWLERLERLKQRVVGKAVDLPFLGQPNDIAVTVQSIKSIPDSRVLSPQIREVACDHLTYFDCEIGLKALLTVLNHALSIPISL